MVGLVADDLTGACDSAAPFLAGGRVLVSIWPQLPAVADGVACLAVSTESRSGEAAVSRERSRAAAMHLAEGGPRLLYRKVDSLMRGNVAADIQGFLDACPGRCIFAPALPAAGRTTSGGVQRWPGGEADLHRLVSELGPRVSVRDAKTDSDLAAIAGEILESEPAPLPAGTAGLAQQLAAILGGGSAPASLPLSRDPLALIGSTVARPQGELALRRGWSVQFRAKGEQVDLDGHDGIFLSGGSTAAGVLTLLGAAGIELLGELGAQIPVGTVSGGPHHGLPVALKGGHFGSVEAIDLALRRFAGG